LPGNTRTLAEGQRLALFAIYYEIEKLNARHLLMGWARVDDFKVFKKEKMHPANVHIHYETE
jgi:hypothetical protein